MKKHSLYFVPFLAALVLSGCKKEDNPIRPIDVTTKVVYDIDTPFDLTGCTLVTMQGEFPVGDNDGSQAIVVGTFQSNNPQLILLVDASHNILMLSREVYDPEKENVIDVNSSAMAMVTLHPLFSPVPVGAYPALKQYVESSGYYAPFVETVREAVAQRRSLFDSSNSALLDAFSTLLNDLCSENLFEEGFYPFTKASGGVTNINGINAGPFTVMLNGLILGICNYALTPYYEGKVTFPDGQYERMDIPSNDDYGVTDFVTGRDLAYGDPVEFNFAGKPEGDYVFHFDRTTTDASLDYWCKLISNVLDGLGLPLDKVVSKNLAGEIWSYIVMDMGGSLISNDRGSILEWMETITSGVVSFLGSENFHIWAEENLSDTIVSKLAGNTLCRYLAVAYGFYTFARGSVNSSMLLYYAANQPNTVFFVLSYDDGSVKAASNVYLQKTKGDNQNGVKGQMLNLPLEVKVYGNYLSTQDGVAQPLCKVRYTVVSGGGVISAEEVNLDSDGKASVYWTLGSDSNAENIVKAIAIDLATGEAISEEVEFRAGFMSDAAITVRLDWDKTATDTDIDLHVVDPRGHHIYWKNMYCYCGGFLDRDDRQGPGPEHIIYSSAPAGTYEVYVHHYPNDKTMAYSVAFTVTAIVGEKTYRSHGSVSYDQMVSLGTFMITDTRSMEDADFSAFGQLQEVIHETLPAKE